MLTTSTDAGIYKFVEYTVDSICGTMKSISLKGTKVADAVVPASNGDIVFQEAINLFLDAENDDEDVAEDRVEL